MKVAEDGGKPISSEVPLSFLFKSTFLMTVSLSFLLSLLSFFRKYPHVTKKRRSSKTDFAPIVPGLVTCGVRVFFVVFFSWPFFSVQNTDLHGPSFNRRDAHPVKASSPKPAVRKRQMRLFRPAAARSAVSPDGTPRGEKTFSTRPVFPFFFLSADEGHPAEDNGEDSWDGNTRNGNVNRNWVWWVPDAPVG